MRFDGWEQRNEAHSGPMLPGAPTMCVLHTMQGSFESGVASLTARANWPHGCYDPATRRKIQGVDTDNAAKALGNLPGGVETNRHGAIQYELAGFAQDTHDWPDEWLRNIAEDIIVPGYSLGLWDFTLPPLGFLGADSGAISRVDAPQRFTPEQWEAFHGICGHQHVPENGDRWDPGKLNVPRIIEHAQVLLGASALTKGSDAMLLEDSQGVHLFSYPLLTGISQAQVDEYRKTMGPPLPLPDDYMTRVRAACDRALAGTASGAAAGSLSVTLTGTATPV